MNFLINRSLSKTLAVAVVAASLLGAANVARAVLINVTVDTNGTLLHAPVGIADKTQYLAADGNVNGNSPTDNFNFLVTEVTRYNLAFSPDLPLADATPSAINTPAANVEGLDVSSPNSYTTLAGWDYVVFHFGAGKAGSGGVSSGGYWQAFYLGGDAVSFAAVPQIAGQSVGGFSSARYFNQDVHVVTHNVPDSGSTVIPLGLALLAIGFVARKKKV